MSKRGTPEEEKFRALREGVPAHMKAALLEWTLEQLLIEGISQYLEIRPVFSAEYLQQIELEMEAPLGPDPDERGRVLGSMCEVNPEFQLDMIDYLLRHPLTMTMNRAGVRKAPGRRAGELSTILDRGRSAWTVKPLGEVHALERRVAPATEAVLEIAGSSSTTAGAHLGNALHLVYGRSPNPGESYRESIKAVEVAAIPVVIPKDETATLGKILGELRARPDRWMVVPPASSSARPGAEGVADLIEALWTGQKGRHGEPGHSEPRNNSPAEAETAVHLAATLVQWFGSGAIRKR